MVLGSSPVAVTMLFISTYSYYYSLFCHNLPLHIALQIPRASYYVCQNYYWLPRRFQCFQFGWCHNFIVYSILDIIFLIKIVWESSHLFTVVSCLTVLCCSARIYLKAFSINNFSSSFDVCFLLFVCQNSYSRLKTELSGGYHISFLLAKYSANCYNWRFKDYSKAVVNNLLYCNYSLIAFSYG